MGIGTNLQNIVSTEAAAVAALIVIFFGIQFWLKKETGKFIGALAILAICLTFIIDPSTIVTFLTGFVRKVLSGANVARAVIPRSPVMFVREIWGGMAA